ncbi:hypothetical protein GGF37_001042, partial [Kickxella alabastrina]
MSSGYGANGLDPSSSTAGNTNDHSGGGGGGGNGRTDDFAMNFSQNSMFMANNDGNMDEMWGIGGDAAANIFFNMDAFSSAPTSAVGNATPSAAMPASSAPAPASASASAAAGALDLASLGFDMTGGGMDPEAWKMLLQGDPAMDDLFGGFAPALASTALDPQAAGAAQMGSQMQQQMVQQQQQQQQHHQKLQHHQQQQLQLQQSQVQNQFHHQQQQQQHLQHQHQLQMGTLAPADLEALTRAPPQQPMSAATLPPALPATTLKSPATTTKKPRQPKAKKAPAPKGEKTTKSKAKKAATPKLKSPTPQPTTPQDSSPGNATISPNTEIMRKIRPKAEGAAAGVGVGASPTPSAKSASVQQAVMQSQQVPPRGLSDTPTGILNGQQQHMFSPPVSAQNPQQQMQMQMQQSGAMGPASAAQASAASMSAAAMFQMPQQQQ